MTLTDDNVHIRSQPNLNGEIVGKLKNGDDFTVLGRTGNTEKIGKMNSYWYKLKTRDGIEGFSYGHFFDYLIDDEKLVESSIKDDVGNYIVNVARATRLGYEIYRADDPQRQIDIATSDEAQRLVNDLLESAEAMNDLVEGFMGFD